MGKVRVSGAADLDRHFPKYWSGRVTVKVAGGSSFMHEVVIPKGDTGNAMTQEEIEEKFLSLATSILGEGNARSVIQKVQSLDSQDSLEPLLAALRTSG